MLKGKVLLMNFLFLLRVAWLSAAAEKSLVKLNFLLRHLAYPSHNFLHESKNCENRTGFSTSLAPENIPEVCAPPPLKLDSENVANHQLSHGLFDFAQILYRVEHVILDVLQMFKVNASNVKVTA